MDLDIQIVPNLTAEWLRMAVSGSVAGLYTAALDPTQDVTGFNFSLTSVGILDNSALTPPSLAFGVALPVPPAWDIVFSGNAAGSVAWTDFGGAWSALQVPDFSGTESTGGYEYAVEQTDRPRFVRNSSISAAKHQFVSALFSGYQLGIIGLQQQDDKLVPHVSGIVGTLDNPVADGAVFGDLSAGLPLTVGVVYLKTLAAGRVSPNGTLPGTLYLVSYDINNDKLGTPVELLDGLQVSEFDLAVIEDTVCLLASTGSGALLLALFSSDGTSLGSANLPTGSWSNSGHWITSPSVVPNPGTLPGFTLGFIEMDDTTPVAVYVGTLSSPQGG